jgi:hypothetical protein
MIEHSDIIGDLIAAVLIPGTIVGSVVGVLWLDARCSTTTPRSPGRATNQLPTVSSPSGAGAHPSGP